MVRIQELWPMLTNQPIFNTKKKIEMVTKKGTHFQIKSIVFKDKNIKTLRLLKENIKLMNIIKIVLTFKTKD